MAQRLSRLLFRSLLFTLTAWPCLISGREISSLMQAELVARDSNCQNGTWSAVNGLQFDLACGSSYENSDLTDDPLTASNINQCMNLCSNYTEPCYGVMFNYSSHECFLKDSGIKDTNTGGSKTNSAIVSPQSQYKASDTSCGGLPDNGNATLTDNAVFEIHCNEGFTGSDYTPLDGEDFNHPYHANSFQDCITLCENAHPLCSSVVWNADMSDGYGNCYPKTIAPTSLDAQADGTVFHTAILQLDSPSNDCDDTANYTSQANGTTATYGQYCQEGVTASKNLTSLHADSWEGCMDLCTANSTCDVAVYDWDMGQGYNNCYLMEGLQSSFSQSFTNYGLKTTTSSTEPSSSSGSSSLAWIAGPIVGGIVAIAAAVAIWWFCFHRKKNAQVEVITTPSSYYQEAVQQDPYEFAKQKEFHQQQQMQQLMQQQMLQQQNSPVELASSPAAVAHEVPSPSTRVELPT